MQTAVPGIDAGKNSCSLVGRRVRPAMSLVELLRVRAWVLCQLLSALLNGLT